MRVPFRRLCAVVLTVGVVSGCARNEVWKVEPPWPMPMLPAVAGPAPGAVALPWLLEGSQPPGRQLVVAVPGADCRTPTGVQVSSTPEAVTITVWGVERSACPSSRRELSAVFGVELPEPLNGRRLEHGEEVGA